MTARFERALALDAQLGDPFDPSAPINHAVSARWDEAEHYPEEALAVLRGLGVAREFVPAGLGGELRGYDQLLTIARVIAGRNLSIAVTMSAQIWSTLVWIAGDDRQQREHAASILAGRTPCLAYSEESHGADLLASDTTARRVAGGYLITGRKWPINRATTGDSVVLLARTGAPGDPRGLSLFWFEKSALDPARYHTLPGEPTLGVRGCDISGLVFEDAFVPDSARLGPEGAGLEIALKGFHITRTLCAGLSLGAVDAALRTTVRLARGRRLYGDTLLALPQVRWTLAEAHALLRALEAAALVITRMFHVSPDQSALISAIAKHAIPSLAEGILSRLTTLHGARFYLRAHHDWGLIQKVFRDNLLISIFDGSSPVNLHALAAQLPLLARFAPEALGGRRADPARAERAYQRATVAADLSAALPAFEGGRLELVSRGADDVVESYALLVRDIEGGLDRDACGAVLVRQLGELGDAIRRLHTSIAAHDGPVRASGEAPARADAAARYAILHIAAAAVHAWWAAAQHTTRRAAPWLVLALGQLLGQSLATTGVAGGDATAIVDAELAELVAGSDRPTGYFHALHGAHHHEPTSQEEEGHEH